MIFNIISPIYNRAHLLPRFFEKLDSIVCPEGDTLNIVLVNDGSTDNSQSMIDDYKKKKGNVFIIKQMNKGTFLARIKGIEFCKDGYLLFLDSDDYYPDDILIKLHNILCQNDVEAVFFEYETIKNNSVTRKKELSHYGLLEDKEIIMLESFYTLCNKLYSLKLYKYEPGFFDGYDGYVYNEDFILNSLFTSNMNKAFFLNETLFYQVLTLDSSKSTIHTNIGKFIKNDLHKLMLTEISDKVPDPVYYHHLCEVVGHVYDSICLVASSALRFHFKKRLFTEIYRSDCYGSFVPILLTDKKYTKRITLKQRTVYLLFRHRLYMLLSFFAQIYNTHKNYKANDDLKRIRESGLF